MGGDLNWLHAVAGLPELGERTEQVVQLQAELTTLRAKLRVIHQPFEARCSECVEWCDCAANGGLGDTCTHGNVPWPCRTAVAAGITEGVEK